MRLIVAALYLACQEQVLRGHNEATGCANRANFVELVHAFAEFDNTLAEHLGHGINKIINHIIQDETDKEIRKSPFIAVQVDDTSDVEKTGWSTWPRYPLALLLWRT